MWKAENHLLRANMVAGDDSTLTPVNVQGHFQCSSGIGQTVPLSRPPIPASQYDK